jgi:hypothetical protein
MLVLSPTDTVRALIVLFTLRPAAAPCGSSMWQQHTSQMQHQVAALQDTALSLQYAAKAKATYDA